MKKQLLFLGAFLTCLTTLNAQDVTDGLVSKYTFDNDSIEDVIGVNNGIAEFETYNVGYGGTGKCISFDGYDGSQTATISKGMIDDSIVPFDQDLTISFWFKLNNYNSSQPMNVLSSRRSQTGSELGGIEFVIRKDPNNTLQVAGRSVSGGLTLEYAIESNTIQTNQWYFATFVQSGSAQSLYVNGSLVGEDLTINMAEQSSFWTIGASTHVGEAAREFDGDLDELRFYDRALSPVEVSQLYNFDPSTASLTEENVNEFNIYPNPVKETLFLDAGNIEVNEIQILDITGKKIMVKNMSLTNTSLDVSDLKKGIYFITLFDGKNRIQKKFIKN